MTAAIKVTRRLFRMGPPLKLGNSQGYPLKGRVSEGAPFEIHILTTELTLGQSAIVLANTISAVTWVAVVYAS